MPKVKKLTAFAGQDPIFIDANIFLFHAFDTRDEAVEFLKKVEAKAVNAWTASLTLNEVFFKILMQQASQYLDSVTVAGVKRLLRNPKQRETIMRPVQAYRLYLQGLVSTGLHIIEITAEDMMVAVEKTRTYGLLITDAAYVAVMSRRGIKHLASDDSDFEVVREIITWKPRI
jgi:hypothetical protein